MRLVIRLAVLAAALVVAPVWSAPALLAGPAASRCAPDVAEIRHGGTELRFSVELADTPETRARGLMFREDLPRFGGMLFVFDRPHRATFWMQNTPLPLDLLFFDQAGVLRSVHADATPFSTRTIDGGEGIAYVLEINGGMAEELGIGPGAELRHPAVDPAEAAWPCPAAEAERSELPFHPVVVGAGRRDGASMPGADDAAAGGALRPIAGDGVELAGRLADSVRH